MFDMGVDRIARDEQVVANVGKISTFADKFQHLGLGTAIILPMTDKALSDRPGLSDLGTDFVLVWGSEDVG